MIGRYFTCRMSGDGYSGGGIGDIVVPVDFVFSGGGFRVFCGGGRGSGFGIRILEAGDQFVLFAGVGEGARFEKLGELGVFLFGVVG